MIGDWLGDPVGRWVYIAMTPPRAARARISTTRPFLEKLRGTSGPVSLHYRNRSMRKGVCDILPLIVYRLARGLAGHALPRGDGQRLR